MGELELASVESVSVGEDGALEGRMQGKAQLSDSNRRIMELDAPPRRVYQAWKGSNVRVSLSLSRLVYDSAVFLKMGHGYLPLLGFC